MAHNQYLLPRSYTCLRLSWNSANALESCSERTYYELNKWWNWRQSGVARLNCNCTYGAAGKKKPCSVVVLGFRRNWGRLVPLASTDDVAAVNGIPRLSKSADGDGETESSASLNRFMEDGDVEDWLIKSLHDAARAFELAIKDRGLVTSLSWFSAAWLGIDRNAWVKTLSYQGAVYSLLQAATEIASRGEGRDRDVNIIVQRSLIRQSSPLQSVIKDKLSAKQPAYQWFWSEQIPAVVASFVAHFEEDVRFSTATAVHTKSISTSLGSRNDVSLLSLSLASMAAIIKLGPAKVSCPPLSSLIAEETGRLMDLLVDFVPISQAYNLMLNLGLRREFLLHFGPRAAALRVTNDSSSSEVVFWVDLVQEQLQKALDRERIWSKLTTSESIEVLDKDLAVFGFFVALGKSSQSFLRSNGFDDIDHSFELYFRYLIGGSALYYPQLSSISLYQLFVEVVCEELDWLPFYQGSNVVTNSYKSHSRQEVSPNADAIPILIDVCSHWMQSFIKYSKWLERPSNIKAARFLAQGHSKLMDCVKEMCSTRLMTDLTASGGAFPVDKSDSFEKALDSVEEALVRLENLLEELHVSKSNSGTEQLEAACSELEKIRKLKKQAEFLEVSFRAKAASLQQDNNECNGNPSRQQDGFPKRKPEKRPQVKAEGRRRNSGSLWNLFVPLQKGSSDFNISAPDNLEDEPWGATNDDTVAESIEADRFKTLRNELMELEQVVRRSTENYDIEEDFKVDIDGNCILNENYDKQQSMDPKKEESFVEKSLTKMKQTSLDVLQGTQLLAIDAATATGFLRRALIGDELTDKERKALSRTLTDLASVVPIGILMLLPVTAVGHAAILAAIQRYMPALIPSAYGRERLDLLRYLERMKELEGSVAVDDSELRESS